MYSTSWIPGVAVTNSRSFLWRSFAYHALRALPNRVLHPRTSQLVKERYDESRQALLDRLEQTDWDSYVRFPADKCDFILVDDDVIWGPLRTARDRVMGRLQDVVGRHARAGATVVEFGSGDGRNLLFLQRLFPDMHFIGLELSEVSVELSRRAAQRFGLSQIRFHAANVCDPITVLPPRHEVVLAFSCFALEMMPRSFPRAIENMAQSSSDGLAFFEPIDDLWKLDLRGITSRLRVLQLDRMSGFVRSLRSVVNPAAWTIEAMERSSVGLNPLNEMCEVLARRR